MLIPVPVSQQFCARSRTNELYLESICYPTFSQKTSSNATRNNLRQYEGDLLCTRFCIIICSIIFIIPIMLIGMFSFLCVILGACNGESRNFDNGGRSPTLRARKARRLRRGVPDWKIIKPETPYMHPMRHL